MDTPKRLTTNDILVRAVTITSYQGNKGEMYIATSEADATTIRREVIQDPLDWLRVEADNFANERPYINLKDLWFNGTKAGDQLIVSYILTTEPFQ